MFSVHPYIIMGLRYHKPIIYIVSMKIILSLHVPPEVWSSPNITGQPPSPCGSFSLTQVSERRAALFGGLSGSRALSDLFVVELSRHTVVSVVRKQYYRLGNFAC